MPIIALANQKGGVGKTTSAVNLAAGLAHLGQQTLLIDLDPQANATSGLGVTAPDSMTAYELLLADGKLAQLSQKTTIPGLSLVAGSAALAGAEVELAQAEGRYVRLARALEGGPYRYIIVDCPPSLGFLSLNALVAARHVLIPVQAEYYALEGLSSLLDVIRKVKANFNPDLEVLGIFLTMYDKRLRMSADVASELTKHFPKDFLATRIPRNITLAEASSFGEPIESFAPASPGARAFIDLTKEVHDAIEARARQRA